MTKIYTLVGLPASGKSTFASQHPECTVVSSDGIRKEWYGDEAKQGDARKVFKEVRRRVDKAVAEGHDVIIDATNISPRDRHETLKAFPEHENIAIYFNVPKETCIRRNSARERKVPIEVIVRMALRLTPPTLDEGFTKIIEIKE